jgi:hypothetical protein
MKPLAHFTYGLSNSSFETYFGASASSKLRYKREFLQKWQHGTCWGKNKVGVTDIGSQQQFAPIEFHL